MNNKIVFLLCCTCMPGVFAQDSAAQGNLTLDQAIIRVLENNPKLKIADYEAQAIAARMRHAIQAPADRLGMTVENFAGTGDTVAVRGIETTLSLSRTLELGNKATARGDLVQGEAFVLQSQKDNERLTLLADTAQRFLDIAAVQVHLQLANEAVELAKLTEKTVAERIQAGKAPVTEQYRVAIARTNHELELEHLRHEVDSSRVSLSTLWNEMHPDFDQVEADIFRLNVLPDFEVLTGLLDRNPELVEYLREADLAQARIRLMHSRKRPDLDITAGLRYLGNSNDMAFMLSATVPLGAVSRAQPYIDEAEISSRIAPLNLEQRRLELYSTLFELYQEMKHAKYKVETLMETIIPAAEQMLALYESGYQAGRYSLLELTQAQQLLLESRLQSVERAIIYHSYRIEIDRLTGAQITQW